MAIPVIDVGTILKLGFRVIVRAACKSSIGMLIYLSALFGVVTALIYSSFNGSIFPTFEELINLDMNFISRSEIGGIIFYALDLDTLWGIVKYTFGMIDELIVFFVSFLIALFTAMMSWRWCAAFRDDMRNLYEGL